MLTWIRWKTQVLVISYLLCVLDRPAKSPKVSANRNFRDGEFPQKNAWTYFATISQQQCNFLEIKQNITFVLYILWQNFCTVKKLSQTNILRGNELEAFHCFVVTFIARFPHKKNPEIGGNKVYPLCYIVVMLANFRTV